MDESLESVETRIAVIMTVHGRLKSTKACLNSLKKYCSDLVWDLYLTVDGKEEEYIDYLKTDCPAKTNVYFGDGKLFWAGGMYKSWLSVEYSKYSHVLLLNNDIVLKSTISELVKLDAIQVGSFISNNGTRSYGLKIAKDFVGECDIIKSYDNRVGMNANFVLCEMNKFLSIGGFPPVYRHAYADYHIGLQLLRRGYTLQATKVIGVCNNNEAVHSSQLSLRNRFDYLLNPTGIGFRDYVVFNFLNFSYLQATLNTVYVFLKWTVWPVR